MGLFDKKYCDVCGEKIKFLGNRKLEVGNLCKECASKLSPWFYDRRKSTVESIKEQLDYREQNKAAVSAFNTTRTLGINTKVLLDEDAGKFIVTAARDLEEENPDVISISQVTGCRVDVEEEKNEIMREDSNGKEVSYNPPRYIYYYDFSIVINVNAPFFDEIHFKLGNDSVESQTPISVNGTLAGSVPVEYAERKKLGDEIVEALMQIRTGECNDSTTKSSVVCPWCGATTSDNTGKCEYCEGSLNS